MADLRTSGAEGDTLRHVLLLDLKDEADAIAAYEAAHRPGGVPSAVLDSIGADGIRAMTIYRAGNRLVMVVETSACFDSDLKAARDQANPDVRAWEERMDLLQQRLPFAVAGEKWVAAAPIFDLAEHGTATT